MRDGKELTIHWSTPALPDEAAAAELLAEIRENVRALERAGFVREGYLRERYEVGGEIQDSVYLGLLRSEWTGATPEQG